MDRVARGRFCQSCVKQVFDLSSMTEGQARGLLQEVEGSRICVRYEHDDGGRIRFREASPTTSSATCASIPRRVAWVGGAIMAATMAACTPHEPIDASRGPVVDSVEVLSPAAIETIPHAERPTETKGEIVAIEPPREVEPPPRIERLHQLKGDVAAVPPPMTVKGNMEARVPELDEAAAPDEPCDGAPSPDAPPSARG